MLDSGLEIQVQHLDREVATLRSQVEKLVAQLGEVSKQGNDNHSDIASLATKIDGLREDLKGFKDLPNSFVSRDMLNAKLEGYEQQLRTLQNNFAVVQGQVSQLQGQLTNAQLDISKNIQANTQWTIGTLIALLFAVVGLASQIFRH